MIIFNRCILKINSNEIRHFAVSNFRVQNSKFPNKFIPIFHILPFQISIFFSSVYMAIKNEYLKHFQTGLNLLFYINFLQIAFIFYRQKIKYLGNLNQFSDPEIQVE